MGQDFVEERRRQERRVGLRRCARHGSARVGEQPLDQRNRPRRGGDELARPAADPQAELQHVERRLRMAPFGEFVAPRGIELRAAQRFRILGRERLRHRAVRPFEAPARRDPVGPLRARGNPQDSGDAFDHHLAGVVLALADQRDMAVAALGIGRSAVGCGAHPLGAEPCFAGAAPAQHQPGGPRLAIGSPAVVGGLRRLLCACASAAKSWLARSSVVSGTALAHASSSPALHKHPYASRKLATEFIDVSGHVVIGKSVVREQAAAQAGERM